MQNAMMSDGIAIHQFPFTLLPMATITLQLPDEQAAELAEAAKSAHLSLSEFVAQSLGVYLAKRPLTSPPTLHDQLKKYIPAVGTGIQDLSTNPKHLEGLGAD
jgi:hypothetical protein